MVSAMKELKYSLISSFKEYFSADQHLNHILNKFFQFEFLYKVHWH